ncbi:unknown [Bifidobacterium longum CAG:69]|nr:unknown [Bifidobacterium longum CAG:69]
MRAFKGADVDVFLVVALVEVLAIGLGGEQRRHGGRVGRQVLQLVQTLQDIVARVGLEMVALIVGIRVGLQCRTVGHVQVGVGRHDELVDLALKRALECGAQLGHEEQRAAEEDDGAVNRASGSQAGDGLRGHCGEDGGGQIGLGGTIIDERLQIGFGEHTTTRGDWIQVLVALGHLVEAGGVGVEQCGHLVNERAGTTCARTVHALFGRGFQVGDFGVLAAELDDDIGLRVFLVDCLGFGDDLLNERHMQIVSKRQTAGTGDRQANRFIAASEVHKLLVDVDQQAGHGGTHVGVVASVIGEEGVSQGIGLIKHHGLDGGGTDVQSHTQGLRV